MAKHAPLELLQSVEPGRMTKYLSIRGWRNVRHIGSIAATYVHGANGNSVLVRIPLDQTLADYGSRVEDVVQAVAAVEHRTEDAVLRDLVSDIDTIRISIVGREDPNSALSFQEFKRAVDGAYGVLSFSASRIFISKLGATWSSLQDVRHFMDIVTVRQENQIDFSLVSTIPLDYNGTHYSAVRNNNIDAKQIHRDIVVDLLKLLHEVYPKFCDMGPSVVFSGEYSGLMRAVYELFPLDSRASVVIDVSWSPFFDAPIGVQSQVVLTPACHSRLEELLSVFSPDEVAPISAT